ncbi:hypothetical protein FALCPG4_005899 [Fusarium falciforme]
MRLSNEHASVRFLAQGPANASIRDIITIKLGKRPTFLSRDNHTRSNGGKTSLAGKTASSLFHREDNGLLFILSWKDEGWHLACEAHLSTIWPCRAAAIRRLALPESLTRDVVQPEEKTVA